MPNWCECDLEISGPVERVREFLEFAKGEDASGSSLFDFNRFVPYPERFDEQDRINRAWLDEKPWEERTEEERESSDAKDGFNSGGYQWCVENWGTKWDAKEPRVDEQYEQDRELEAMVMFETAWSPPLPVIKRAAELYPDISFTLKYFERGACYNGMYCCEGGEVVYDESGPYFGDRGG